MFKAGGWVHTEDGIGQAVLLFPCYYQFWEKIRDEVYREDVYGKNENLANSLE